MVCLLFTAALLFFLTTVIDQLGNFQQPLAVAQTVKCQQSITGHTHT